MVILLLAEGFVMETKEGTLFAREDDTFLAPRIKQAINGQVTSDLFEDCTIVAPVPSSAELGQQISYSLYVEYVGSFFQHPRKIITQELLDKGEVAWQMFRWRFVLRPRAVVRVSYYIVNSEDDRCDSPIQEYTVS